MASGSSVISVNSNRGSQFTVGDLRSSSSHRGGCLRRRAGVEKLLGVISVCLDRVIKAGTPSPSLFLLSLFFFRRRRSSPSCPRRRHSASPSPPSLPQLRLSLAHRLSISPHRKWPRLPFTPRPAAMAAVPLHRRAAGSRGQAVTGRYRPSCGHP